MPLPLRGCRIGFLFFLGSFPLIWWNEGRALGETLTLDEGHKLLKYVPHHDKLEGNLLGQLVHVAGPIDTDAPLRDAEFGISVPSALRLSRDVEMYQYREHKSSRTGRDSSGREVVQTSVSYSPDWTADRIDSHSFEDERYRGKNPSHWPVQRTSQYASSAFIGAYKLPSSVIRSLGSSQPVDVTNPSVSAIGKLLLTTGTPAGSSALLNIGGVASKLPREGHERPSDRKAVAVRESLQGLAPIVKSMALASDGRLYTGSGGPTSPSPGDQRVTFSAAAPSHGSVIARLERGGRLVPFRVPKTGRDLLLSYEGELTPDEMFDRAHAANSVTTWALRGAGWLLAVIGLALVLQPAAVAPTWIPLIGSLAGDVVSCGITVVALIVGSTTATATVAVAWFAVRPMLSAGLLAACAAVFGATMWWGRRQRTPAAAAGEKRD